MDILSQIMRLPFDVVAMSIEPFLRMARDAERSTAMDALRQTSALMPRALSIPSAPPVGLPAVVPAGVPAGVPVASSLPPLVATGGNHRRDDMNDNLVKLVRYSIVFTKPDEERILSDDEECQVVNYPTTAEELAAIVLLEWVKDHQDNPAVRDPKDWRYLKVRLHVIERYAVEDKYYDRRQTQAQEKIARNTEGLVCD